MNLVYAPRALRDLEAIAAYLGQRSETGLASVLAAIKSGIEDLLLFPRAGVPIDREGRFRWPLRQYPYVIFYRLTESEIIILHVRHASRQPLPPQDV